MGINLHLGCGKRRLPGYINIDIINYPSVDRIMDVTNLDAFDDNSVSIIYASHILEHFFLHEVDQILSEWYRVLRSEGVLRLSVPDFEKLVFVYNKYKDIRLIMGPLYGKGVIIGANETPHRFVYDEATLRKLLREAGFNNITRWDWRKVFVGELKDFDDYSQAYIPHMDKKNGELISLNIEAYK